MTVFNIIDYYLYKKSTVIEGQARFVAFENLLRKLLPLDNRSQPQAATIPSWIPIKALPFFHHNIH
jgi:hypothetical protein